MADALSRMDHDIELWILSIPVWLEWDEPKLEVGSDPKLRAIISYLSAGVGKHVFYSLANGWLLYKDCVAPKIRIGCRRMKSSMLHLWG